LDVKRNNMILVIDDDKAIRSSLRILFDQGGYEVMTAEGPREALAAVKEQVPDLIILDMNFSVSTSGEEGLALLNNLKLSIPQVPVILITAWGSIPLAVDGMKAGAVDFITKPWNNEHLLNSVKTAQSLARKPQLTSSSFNREQLNKQYNFENIVGSNSTLLEILETAGRISSTDAPVLIMGESGTGKELVAEAVHNNSERKNEPFVKVNLGGIPSALFESEMFGHKKGAFTSAIQDRIGRFELAEGGTIFMDEIGDLDPGNQVKLLRVLQDRSFEVLGTSVTKTIDFRVICATNKNLEQMVERGQFREDLFYRINLISLKLPPLRERQEDIPLLINYFVDNLKIIYRRKNLEVSPSALSWLAEFPWHGNIRELKNIVERAVLVTDKEYLEISDFESQLQPVADQNRMITLPAVGTVTIDEMEKSMIKKALEFHENNISRVARSLGLSRGALYRRLEKHGITV